MEPRESDALNARRSINEAVRRTMGIEADDTTSSRESISEPTVTGPECRTSIDSPETDLEQAAPSSTRMSSAVTEMLLSRTEGDASVYSSNEEVNSPTLASKKEPEKETRSHCGCGH